MVNWTPRFGGIVAGQDGSEFIRLENLTTAEYDYLGAYVLDCKLGVRTFVEKEATNTKLREDLFLKLKKLDKDGSELTAEERERGAITKYRWMSAHDAHSTTTT